MTYFLIVLITISCTFHFFWHKKYIKDIIAGCRNFFKDENTG